MSGIGYHPRGLMALLAAAVSVPGASAIPGYGKLRSIVRSSEPSGSVPYLKTPGSGHTAAHVKRIKRKTRNRLRAKGQFRKAVR